MNLHTGLDEDSKTDREEMKTDTDTESEEEEVKVFENDRPPTETKYMENAREELGQVRASLNVGQILLTEVMTSLLLEVRQCQFTYNNTIKYSRWRSVSTPQC